MKRNQPETTKNNKTDEKTNQDTVPALEVPKKKQSRFKMEIIPIELSEGDQYLVDKPKEKIDLLCEDDCLFYNFDRQQFKVMLLCVRMLCMRCLYCIWMLCV